MFSHSGNRLQLIQSALGDVLRTHGTARHRTAPRTARPAPHERLQLALREGGAPNTTGTPPLEMMVDLRGGSDPPLGMMVHVRGGSSTPPLGMMVVVTSR